MKKIFFALTLILAISFTSNAQEKRTKVQEISKTESSEVAALLNLNETQTADIYRLFEMKNEALSNATLSDERRSELTRIMDMKMRATFTADQISVLEAKAGLYSRLTGKKETK